MVFRNWRWTKKKNYVVSSLYEHMKKVPDPRCDREKEHECAAMLTYLIMAYIVGRCSLRRAQKWAQQRLKWLRKTLKIKKSIASVSTIQRLLAGIDHEEFVAVFTQWITEILKPVGINIIIDGKALRGATERIKDGTTPYILNAIDMATKLVLSQLAIECKKNEISTIPDLLDRLEMKENTVLIDAIGTQVSIIDRILDRSGYYFLTVKKNQLSIYEEILGFFRMVEEQMRKDKERDEEVFDKIRTIEEHYSHCITNEKNRERYEYREVHAYGKNIIQTRSDSAFDSVQCIGKVRNVRVPIEKDDEGNDITRDLTTFLEKGSVRNPKIKEGDSFGDDVEEFGLIANRMYGAEEMLELNRLRWTIEASLHHVLDDVFREDRSPAKKCKNNLALIRKFAYNIIRIAIIKSGRVIGVQEMMDEFADDWDLLERYTLQGIEALN